MTDIQVRPELVERVLGLLDAGRVAVLGITGAPGAGKTTLTLALLRELRSRLGEQACAHVPMDGFHLADASLDRLGLLERKGAPETFDAWGYAALLERVRGRRHPDEVVWVPGFERDLEQPLAGSLAVGPATRVVVTEGNYLLLDDAAWRAAHAACDEVWFVDTDESLRRRWLTARHVEFGKSPQAAARWVDEVDQPNADRVAAARDRADLVVHTGT